MFKKITVLMMATVVVSLCFATGCMTTSKVNQLMDVPVNSNTGGSLSSAQVRKAILAAATKRGWVARELSPGVITATLAARGHKVVVDIPYSGSSFSIIYKNSENLDYNSADNTIHGKYNSWVANLRHDIDARLGQIR